MNKDPNRLNINLRPENKCALESIRAHLGLRSLNAAVNRLIEDAWKLGATKSKGA